MSPHFSVLFVCIGNVCRSPLGERLLAARLPSDRFAVSSAGIRAMVGHPMDPEAAQYAAEEDIDVSDFVSRQLNERLVSTADLILTATQDLRSRVLEEHPGALRRTFSVREFAALASRVEADDPRALVTQAVAARSSTSGDDLDIADPYGRGPEVHRTSAEAMRTAVDAIAAALVR